MTTLHASLPHPRDAPTLAVSPRVLHSQHYHVALLRMLLEVDRIDARALLAETAAAFTLEDLRDRFESSGGERLREAEDRFRESGLGRLDLSGMGREGGEARVLGSYFGRGWAERYPRTREPVCAVPAGIVAGALAAAFSRAFTVRETECVTQGAADCRFRAEPAEGPLPALADPLPVASSLLLPSREAWGLDEEEIVATLVPDPPTADPQGRLSALGSDLAWFWPDFYARIAERFGQEVPGVMGAKFANLPSLLLTEAGHLHGYHFLGGLLRSPEWTSGIAPRLSSREEGLHAVVALIGALGWGAWRVHALVPGERLVVRIYDSYEAVGHRRRYGIAEAPRCYHARGVVAALMNLLYVGDPAQRAAATSSDYNRLFRSPGSFRAVETCCRAQDAPYCELVANPLSSALGTRM